MTLDPTAGPVNPITLTKWSKRGRGWEGDGCYNTGINSQGWGGGTLYNDRECCRPIVSVTLLHVHVLGAEDCSEVLTVLYKH